MANGCQATVRTCNDYCGSNGPLVRYVKLWVAQEPGMPGTFFPPPRFSDPDMHHGTCVTHVPWCMPGSLTSGFLWSQWREKGSRHSRRMRNPRFCVSGKRPMCEVSVLSEGDTITNLINNLTITNSNYELCVCVCALWIPPVCQHSY